MNLPPQPPLSPQDDEATDAVPKLSGTAESASEESVSDEPAGEGAGAEETVPPTPSAAAPVDGDAAGQAFDELAAQAVDDTDAYLARLTGEVIGGYRLENRLGGGAHSSVYRAVNLTSGAVVALKILLPGADGVARARFRHEARTALSLDHPHIVRTLSVEQTADDDVAYIAMELVEGLSLADLLERYRQLSVLDACTILGPITAALAHAHKQGIIHRDVKPSNILLRRAPKGSPGAVDLAVLDYPIAPLLTDFGIARALDAPELTSVGRTIGTPAYMAPEQCEGGREIDGRADIYSLGAVLYRCLVGRPPYVGTTTQILYAHVFNSLTIPDEVLIELPVQVVHILKRSLAKSPRDRYPTAADMANDLAQITGRYAAMSRAAGVSPDEATRTMSSLPTMRPQTDAFSVLVPAINRHPPAGALPVTPTRTSRTLDVVARPRTLMERVSIPWVAMGIVTAAMLFIVSFGLLLRNTPLDLRPGGFAADAEVTPAEISSADPITPEGVTATPNASPSPEADVAGGSTPTSIIQIPSVDVGSAWADAVFFHDERDWQLALDQLTFILRTDADFNNLAAAGIDAEAAAIRQLFLDDAERPFWSAAAAYFGPEDLADILFDIYVGAGARLNAQGRQGQAVAYYRAALAMKPDATQLADVLQATVGYANALPANRPDARQNLQEMHLAYADELQSGGQYCAAADQVAAAIGSVSTPALVVRLGELETLCVGELTIAAGEVPLEQLGGTLIYSSRSEGADRIYAVPAAAPDGGGATQSATLLVEDAVNGALLPGQNRLSFYSTRINAQGLFMTVLDGQRTPRDRGDRYTRFAEDGEESPASWSPGGDRLAFASRREGDKQSRIYVTQAGGEDDSRNIANGADPAWHPAFDRIAYSGVDFTGNRPGVWLVDSAGGNPQRLTTVQSDISPQWSPGGQYLVFTSLERDGNWEIYRLDLTDLTILRMTNDGAQDVLPVVSPDGQVLAFFSDRGGAWQIWAMPLEGGEAVVLAPIEGEIPVWAESSLQWVP